MRSAVILLFGLAVWWPTWLLPSVELFSQSPSLTEGAWSSSSWWWSTLSLLD